MKEITITVDENAASDLADILCYLAGVIDAKGVDWKHTWLTNSIDTLRDVKIAIQHGLKP